LDILFKKVHLQQVPLWQRGISIAGSKNYHNLLTLFKIPPDPPLIKGGTAHPDLTLLKGGTALSVPFARKEGMLTGIAH
jgi:hypothetical protein